MNTFLEIIQSEETGGGRKIFLKTLLFIRIAYSDKSHLDLQLFLLEVTNYSILDKRKMYTELVEC